MSSLMAHPGAAAGGAPISDFAAEDFGAAKGAQGAKRTLGGAAPGAKAPGAKPQEPKKPGGPDEAEAGDFEELAFPEGGGTAAFKADNLGEPSLDYLFSPFDPGGGAEPQDKGFKELKRPEKIEYDFKDLDPRDENIINTLERANKKAKEIIYDSFTQARRLEGQVLDAARLEAEELGSELKSRAEAEALEIVEKAKGQAEAIAKAAAQADEARAAERLKLDSDLKDFEGKLSDLGAREAALAARAGELDAQKAKLGEDEAEMAARKADLEKNFKAESEAALAQAVSKGRSEGFDKGLAEGSAKGRSEVLAKAEGFFKIIGKAGGIYLELWKDKAPMMTALAVEAAEAIVNKEIEGGKGLAAGALKACVDHLHKCHEAVFRVRPEDLAEVEAARASLRDSLDGLVNIEFKADEALGPGDLVMESDAGRLDATMKARRERVMSVLRDALDQGLVADLPPDGQDAPGAAQAPGRPAGDSSAPSAQGPGAEAQGAPPGGPGAPSQGQAQGSGEAPGQEKAPGQGQAQGAGKGPSQGRDSGLAAPESQGPGGQAPPAKAADDGPGPAKEGA